LHAVTIYEYDERAGAQIVRYLNPLQTDCDPTAVGCTPAASGGDYAFDLYANFVLDAEHEWTESLYKFK
jgi:hypothetical protein